MPQVPCQERRRHAKPFRVLPRPSTPAHRTSYRNHDTDEPWQLVDIDDKPKYYVEDILDFRIRYNWLEYLVK